MWPWEWTWVPDEVWYVFWFIVMMVVVNNLPGKSDGVGGGNDPQRGR